MTESLRTTPLHEEHLRLGAKMGPFAGFSMPIHYLPGIQAEHRAVRDGVGIFDVSHMGELEVSGPEALGLVQHVTVNDASRLDVGQAQYSALCREDGGVLDDLLVYRVAQATYLLVVNAGNRQKDLSWILEAQSGFDADVQDRSDETALLAVQGPRAEAVLTPLVDEDLQGIDFYRSASMTVAGVRCLVARTGYTGEDGFELYLPTGGVVGVWMALLDTGADMGILPVGLGARDSLRLEVGYPLYGHDLDEDHTAIESGLGWIVKLGKGPFVGREALRRQMEEGVRRKLTAIQLTETGFPRRGYPVRADGREVGTVTSGTLSPTLGVGIALAYLPPEFGEAGTPVAIRIRGRDVSGSVRRIPFYPDGSRKR